MTPMESVSTARLCHADQSALLVVDIQNRLTAAMPAKVLARIQRNVETLLKAADLLQIPVIATEQYPKGLGSMEPSLVELLPKGARRYEKTTFSCAGAPDFVSDFELLKRKQIILTGMETHVCVLQTALDLMQLGATVFVVADAVCSRHRDNYEVAIQRMAAEGIIVSVTESILFEWLQDSKHESFKDIQARIR